MSGSHQIPGNISKTVTAIEDMFDSADSELTSMERKLEMEFSEMFENENALTDDLRNPVKVMKRLSEVKSEFSKIKQEVSQLQQLQTEALTNLQLEFDKMLTAMRLLEEKAKCDDNSGQSNQEKNEKQLLSLISFMADKTSSSNVNTSEAAAADK